VSVKQWSPMPTAPVIAPDAIEEDAKKGGDDTDFIKDAAHALIKALTSTVLDGETRDLVRSQVVSPLIHMFITQVYPYLLGAGIVVSIMLLMSAITIGLLLLGMGRRGPTAAPTFLY